MGSEWDGLAERIIRDCERAEDAARLWLRHYREGGCKFRTMIEKVRELTQGIPEVQRQKVMGWLAIEASKTDEPTLSEKARPRPLFVEDYLANVVDLYNANGFPRNLSKPGNAFERAALHLREERLAFLTAVALKKRYYEHKNGEKRGADPIADAMNRWVTGR